MRPTTTWKSENVPPVNHGKDPRLPYGLIYGEPIRLSIRCTRRPDTSADRNEHLWRDFNVEDLWRTMQRFIIFLW